MDLSKYAAGKKKYMSKVLWNPGQGETLTIARIEPIEFNERDGSTKEKLVCFWVEDRPPLVLNKTNMNWIIATLGSTEAEWAGKQVHVFHDPTVKYAGKAEGGVVMDVAKPGVDKALQRELRKPAPALSEEPDDDIPF